MSRASRSSISPLYGGGSLRSPRPGNSSPLLPTSRTLSIRLHSSGNAASPFEIFGNAARFRRTRRLGAFVALALTLGVVFWRASGHGSSFETLSEEDKCRKYPWMARCIGKTLAGVHDPFEGLHYEREHGHLFYPAHSAAEHESAQPKNQPHPIHLLMDEAARAWEKKVARQSKTLREAVEEYERRYHRRPPKGFDQWFEFAQATGFVLVDEFDSLDRKLLPFLAHPSSLLRQRSEKLQHDTEFWIQDKTFTVKVRKGHKPIAEGPMANSPNERAQQMLMLLEGIVERLPDMNITFTGHDVPWIGLSGEARQQMVARAQSGEFMPEEKWDDYQDNWDLDGWAAICPPGSPIRSLKHFEDRLEDYEEPPPSFVQDHIAAMDLCTHPGRQTIHGFTAWPGPRPGLLYPIFSFTSTTMHSDFPAPPIDQWDVPVGDDPQWADKLVDKIVWRGTTTGADLNIAHMRKWSQRPRLVGLMREKGTLTVPISPSDEPHKLGRIENVTAPAAVLSNRYFDFKFLGEPQQCNDPVACAEFKKEHVWDDWMDQEDQNLYKYVIDVDGNGWSGRFHRLMSTSTMVLKSTIFPEWYADHIQPWLHYVPVSTDYSDLWAIMAFFKGDAEARGAHDELAKKIGSEGKLWTARHIDSTIPSILMRAQQETHWTWESTQAYFYRLLIEYDRIMNRDDHDPHSMDF